MDPDLAIQIGTRRSAGSDTVETDLSSFQLLHAGRLTERFRPHVDHVVFARDHAIDRDTIESPDRIPIVQDTGVLTTLCRDVLSAHRICSWFLCVPLVSGACFWNARPLTTRRSQDSAS